MSEMVSRIADAMRAERAALQEQPLARIWDRLAIAALKAAREPTEAMVIAGCRHENMGDMAGRYDAMIDEALK